MTDATDPVDLAVPDFWDALGLPRDTSLPPSGMSMEDVFKRVFELYGADSDLRQGDRLRLEVDARVLYQVAGRAPFGTDGGYGVVRAGTEFVVSVDPVLTAIGFQCDPVDHDEAARQLLPGRRRRPDPGGLHLTFLKRDVGTYLTKVDRA